MFPGIKVFLLMILIVMYATARGQEGNNILFGYKFGLNFSDSIPKVFNTALWTISSSACYSDEKGHLKFYVNHDRIFNSSHELVEGNDSLLCMNGYSIFTSSYFIKDLRDSNNILLFSSFFNIHWDPTDTPYSMLREKEHGIYLNILNKNSNNGKGKLVAQNKLLFKGFFDKIEIIRHKNKIDYWILTQSDTNTFTVFLYSKSGISSFSVNKLNNLPFLNGTLKASNKGDALLYTGTYRQFLSDSINARIINESFLLAFNNQTGEIKYDRLIDSFSILKKRNVNYSRAYYFSCFSPNDSLIYLSDFDGTSGGPSFYYNTVFQFQRFKANPSHSKLLIDPFKTNASRLGKMALAPNGKIYLGVTQYCDTCKTITYIPCIEKPNVEGLGCKFNAKAISGNFVGYMFPSDVFYEYLKVNFVPQKLACNTYKFVADCDAKFVNFKWYFDDGDSASGNIVSHSFTKTKLYNIKLKATTTWGYSVWYNDAIFISAPPRAGFTTVSNQGCQYVSYKFINASFTDTAINYTYTWWFGDGEAKVIQKSKLTYDTVEHTYRTSGVFTVKLIFNTGFCTDTFVYHNSVNILQAPQPGFSLSSHRVCAPGIITLKELKASTIAIKEIDFGQGVFVPMNATKSLDTSLVFNAPGRYILKQRLTGITGCVTYHEDTLQVLNGIDKTEKPELLNATFLNDSTIQVEWFPTHHAVSYTIYKNGKTIGQTKGQSFVERVRNEEYMKVYPIYTIRAYDTCDNFTLESNTGRPIILEAQNDNDLLSVVKWTPYEKWNAGVSNYQLKFKFGEDTNWMELANLNGATLNYTVPFSNVLQHQPNKNANKISYQVAATENSGNFKESNSNTTAIYLKPTLFIPNAFSPNGDGLNDYFNPVGLGISSYEMHIYNKWGELIFSSDKSGIGWNGKLQNDLLAESGVYVYAIHAISSQSDSLNKEFYYKGTLKLIR